MTTRQYARHHHRLGAGGEAVLDIVSTGGSKSPSERDLFLRLRLFVGVFFWPSAGVSNTPGPALTDLIGTTDEVQPMHETQATHRYVDPTRSDRSGHSSGTSLAPAASSTAPGTPSWTNDPAFDPSLYSCSR